MAEIDGYPWLEMTGRPKMIDASPTGRPKMIGA
jgi:hypothetical protein